MAASIVVAMAMSRIHEYMYTYSINTFSPPFLLSVLHYMICVMFIKDAYFLFYFLQNVNIVDTIT